MRFLTLIVLWALVALDVHAQTPKNVILIIADGAASVSYTFARNYLAETEGRTEFALDPYLRAMVTTHSANSWVTDSGAAGTALATGFKTNNGMVGVLPDSTRVPSLLHALKAHGKAVGLVTTTRITHATPAAFSSNVLERDNEREIARQQALLGLDVAFGGGFGNFLPESEGGRRTDGLNLVQDLRARGYGVAMSRAEFDGLSAAPAFALFSRNNHLAYEIDRNPAEEPSLAEMTSKAISLLSTRDGGFFLMIEAGRIDHAGHGNDAAAYLHDVLALEEAFAVALAFARENGETLLISTSDHETGGLVVGRNIEGRGQYRFEAAPLTRVRTSAERANERMRAGQTLAETLELFGLTDLTESESTLIAEGGERPTSAMVEIVNRRSVMGWATNGHSGVEVPLYAFGPGAHRFYGLMDNVAIPRLLARILQVNLEDGRRTMLPQP